MRRVDLHRDLLSVAALRPTLTTKTTPPVAG